MPKQTGIITDVKVLDDGRVLVKATDDYGTLIGGQMPYGFQDDVAKDSSVNTKEFSYKIMKSSESSESSIKAKDGFVSLNGSADNRIMSTKDYGNIIVGPTTFTAHPEEIRIGGMFRFNGLLTSTVPSTIITPVSTLVFDFPLGDTLKQLAEVSANFSAQISAMIAATAPVGGI